MNLRLLSLRTTGPDRCLAECEFRGGARVTTEFVVSRQNGITSASPTPDIFVDFDGTANELRQIVAVVVAFSALAAGPLEPGDA